MAAAAAKSTLPAVLRAEAEALRRFIDRVSHRSGAALSKMEEAGITLPQVLLLARVERARTTSITELASVLPGSAAAISQMVDRLVRRNWLARGEDPVDRRRKKVSLTSQGAKLLRDIEQARTGDYAAGLSRLPVKLRAELRRWLEHALVEMDRGGET